MHRILLVVTGSIAAYKAVDLVRLLRARGLAVQVMMTSSATQLVGEATFRAISGQSVLVDEWRAPTSADGMDHIAAARASDFLLVAPASADFIARAAAGMASNLPLSTFLAASCSRAIAPAMNQQMWLATVTQRNVRQLREDGVRILGPDKGDQACGEDGPGRLLAATDIVDYIMAESNSPWSGKRVIVSTGATVEPLDAMRVISNRSSGHLGFCLAEALAGCGARVQIIAGQTTTPEPLGIPVVRAFDNATMRQSLRTAVVSADWFFSVAAVADFRLAQPLTTKPERGEGQQTITLVPTDDILTEIAHDFPALHCVGFAAQMGSMEEMERQARAKMRAKGVRFFALNKTSDAGAVNSQLTLLSRDQVKRLPRLPKRQSAQMLLEALVEVSRETGEIL